ncbi:MAG: IS630 family transposase, partial [Candidatus Hatepunaea meridiana]|nr:IS630 family transposase [Candidatus Hatepunaea meridiana]
MKKYIVTLKQEEREQLNSYISKGSCRSQKVINSLILLACDEGEFQTERSLNKEIAR